MDLEYFRGLLKAKEKDLLSEIGRQQADAVDSGNGDVQDEIDYANQSEEKDRTLRLSSQEYVLLTQVRESLERIDAGTYGKCLECGEPIEVKRLEAVPWASYDLRHQAAHDGPASGGTL